MSEFTLIESLAGEVTIPVDGILSRTIYADDRLKAIVFAFDAGQELSDHTAAVPAVIHVLDGQAEVTLAGEQHEVGPGAWFHLDAGLTHAVLARTPLVMLLLLLPRPD